MSHSDAPVPSNVIYAGEALPDDVGGFRSALGARCSQYLESSFDPSVMRDLLEEQARDVFALPSDETAEADVMFCYVIGSMDDFSSLEELVEAFKVWNTPGTSPESDTPRNWGIYKFPLPSKTPDNIALYVGRGLAFENGWSQDHTFSFSTRIG